MDDGSSGDESGDDSSHDVLSSEEEEEDSLFEDEEDKRSQFLYELTDRIALFGNSKWALSMAFAVLLVAVAVAIVTNDDELFHAFETRLKYRAPLGKAPEIDDPIIHNVTVGSGKLVTNDIRSAFAKDGVVAIRGLLTDDMLLRLEHASAQLVSEQRIVDEKRNQKRSNTQFHMVRMGAAFLDPPSSNDENGEIGKDNVGPSDDERQSRDLSAFREVALTSAVPEFAADLLGLSTDKNQTLRLMRDIFLTKDDEEYVCGWHVDDLGFWPATASSPGVNAWIAIDDMPIANGGGFALAVGSHSASWRHDAHRAIGSTLTFPTEGFQSVADMFENRIGAGTCNLEVEAPHIHRRMEETRRVYDLKRGDIIFHERWVFHRTVPFERSVVQNHNHVHDKALVYRRYSIRYGPGSSVIPRGYGTELSVLWNEENGARSADEVAELDGPWYPNAGQK